MALFLGGVDFIEQEQVQGAADQTLVFAGGTLPVDAVFPGVLVDVGNHERHRLATILETKIAFLVILFPFQQNMQLADDIQWQQTLLIEPAIGLLGNQDLVQIAGAGQGVDKRQIVTPGQAIGQFEIDFGSGLHVAHGQPPPIRDRWPNTSANAGFLSVSVCYR